MIENLKLTDEAIKDLIAENHNTYKSISRITSDYRGEKALTDAYNGRQLLEMLQNADDAKTDKVLLHLDSINGTLIIANNGTPFSIEGLASLMLANNSPKNKRDFIGNKGLGFRSILNWVDVVKIKTKKYVIEFSSVIAKKQFEKLVPDILIRQKLIDNEKDLKKGNVPFAVLAIPNFERNNEVQDWETVIELKYKRNEEKNILEQLRLITPEVLLFLNHTTHIKIAGAGQIDKELILSPSRKNIEKTITINNIIWRIFDSGEVSMPNNSDFFFKYKIAWQNNLCDTETRFATYFPTHVAIHLPYLIHATFDLDPSRNHLNKSVDNEYILNQIAITLKKIAITEIVNENKPDWKALDFLTISGKSENRLLDTFFQSIENAKTELAIYPTLDKKYKTINEVKYYGNEFSEWVKYNQLEDDFPDLILPIPDNRISIKLKITSKYSVEEWKSIFEVVTHKIEDISERVKLIKLLTSDFFKDFQGIQLPLLVNDKKKPVSVDYETYILKKTDTDHYQIQDYVKIAFIDTHFYSQLESIFNDEIEKIRINPNEHKSRALKKIISSVVNFGSNDITDVVRTITRAFNSKVEEEPTKLLELVQSFINSLFQIFKQKKDTEKTTVDNIKVLNRKGELVLSNTVFLGKEFHFGKTTEKLFENIFEENQYLMSNNFWELECENQNADYLDSFFIWLGVNKYSKVKTKKETVYQYYGLDDYTKYVFKKVTPPDLFTNITYDVEEIEFFDILISRNIEIEKLLAWIILDKKIHSKIDSDTNNETFTYSYGNTSRLINSQPSYFIYQIEKSKILEDIFVDLEYVEFLGLKSIDPKHSIFRELGLEDTSVIDTLKKLGVKMSFNDLSSNDVYILLDILKTKNIEAKNARRVYQQAFSYFRNNKDLNYHSLKKQSFLLALKNNKREYRNTEEVYYSDNTTLPSKIIEDFWIFDFPKRSGEKQIAEYFGVKTFKNISIKILKEKISDHPKANEFNIWFNKIKPFLLTYRLNSINSESLSKTVAQDIRTSNIKIVSYLEYSVNDEGSKILDVNEFINQDKNIFYIGADPNLNIEQLKDTPAFCEAFSEILCVLFEVNENKDDFRAIFKDKNHLKDSKYLIETKMLLDKYQEACLLLGLSENEILFWNVITNGKITHLLETISNTTELRIVIKKTIDFSLPNDYDLVNFDFFNNEQSYSFIKSLCGTLNYKLDEIKILLGDFPGLYYWHLERFKQAGIDVEVVWNKAWWYYFANQSAEEQKLYESKRNLYFQILDNIIKKLASNYTFIFEINHKQKLIDNLLKNYDIFISEEALETIEVKNRYKYLLDEFNISLEDLSIETKSLLFFEGNDNRLKIIFSDIVEKETEKETDSIVSNINIPEINSIITSIDAGVAPMKNENRSIKKGGQYSSKLEKQKQKAGKNAEKLVYRKLKELYPNGEIRWLSGNSEDNSVTLDDTRGYDMSYKKNKSDSKWIYLEVKSSTGNSFIISNNEVTVGIQNKENYHLALVNHYDIYFIEDFFLNEIRLDEFSVLRNNTSIRPMNFEIYYKLPKIINF